MSEHESDDQSLCPEETLSQAAALARHLQSSGVEFLPTADEQSVQQWASQFRTPETPQAQLEPQSQAAAAQARSNAEPTATAPTAAPARTPAPARDKPKIVADIVKESYAGDPLDQFHASKPTADAPGNGRRLHALRETRFVSKEHGVRRRPPDATCRVFW